MATTNSKSRGQGKLTRSPAHSRRSKPKVGHVLLSEVPLAEIHPSPENDRLYRPIETSDPEVRALAKSIQEHGICEPLVITQDGFILSGHRRCVAARLAGLTVVPCRVNPIRRTDDINRFTVLLREHNRQRDKSNDEKLREELITADPEESYRALVEHRQQRSALDDGPEAMEIVGHMERKRISHAKAPMLWAVEGILEKLRAYWPLSDRQIHYQLINDPPLKHASKPDSIYDNSDRSYKALTDLATRARVAGLIPMRAIADETRPVMVWDVHPDPRSFIREQLDGFLKHYYRNLLRSQPNHIEIVCEKNTLISVIRPLAQEYCIPMTIGRGFCSLPPRFKIASRYLDSGKEKLILLIVSDFDPDGEEIAQSLARSLRDDFGIESIHPIKVALTQEQVERYRLPPMMKAKKSSSRYGKFKEKYGEHAWEVEALPPETLQEILRDAIDSVIDTDMFNSEIDAERRDAVFLDAVRHQVHEALDDIDWDDHLDDEDMD